MMTSPGKTGSAQVISNAGRVAAARSGKDLRDNGWFVFFAPRDNPEIAGVVFLEHGIHGANAAARGAPHSRYLLREEAGPAAAAGADTRADCNSTSRIRTDRDTCRRRAAN